MKKRVLSRKDIVERVSKWYNEYPFNRCSFWRLYFKRRGWKWNVIWKDLGVIEETEISITKIIEK